MENMYTYVYVYSVHFLIGLTMQNNLNEVTADMSQFIAIVSPSENIHNFGPIPWSMLLNYYVVSATRKKRNYNN